MVTPRDYQIRALDDLRQAIRAGRKRILLVAPTGAGKTTIAAMLVTGASAKGSSLLFLAPRRELIRQASHRLSDAGIDSGIIMARVPPTPGPIQVASIQTLAKRELGFTPTVIVLDEAHHARAKTIEEILGRFPDAIVIGLTATPVRTDGNGLGETFECIVECPGVDQLTAAGYLVPAVTYTQPGPDLSGVARTAGDFNQHDLGAVMNKPKLIGNLVAHWLKYAAGRSTIIFATNIEHSRAIVAEFALVAPAEHLDGNTPAEERDAIHARLNSGETMVVSNVMVYTEGVDCPRVSCIVLDHPTMSLGRYLQMAGRGLRTYPGKIDCLILDHAGCARMHGLAGEPRNWTLEKGTARRGKSIPLADTIHVCPKCGLATPRETPVCPECRYQFSRREIVRQSQGELTKVERVFRPTEDQMEAFYRKLLRAQKEKGYSRFYAATVFQKTCGRKPDAGWAR